MSGRVLRRCIDGTVALLAGLTACVPAMSAEWQLVPSSSVSSGYVDNPRLLPDATDSDAQGEVQNAAEVGVTLTGGTERMRLAVVPRATFSRYRSDETLDRNNQYLTARSSWQGERVTWSGNAQLARDSTQTSELGTTGLVQDNQRREAVTLGAGPQWQVSEKITAGINAQWVDVRYADAVASALQDYVRASGSVSGSVALTERTRLTLSAQGGRLENEAASRVTRDAGLTLGVARELGEQWSLSAAAGPSWADSGFNTNRGTLFSADLARRGERVQIAMGATRQLEPIGTGSLSQSDAVSLSAARQLSERWSVALTGQYNRNEQLFAEEPGGGRRTEYYSAIGSASWSVAPAWKLNLSVEGREQQVKYDPLPAGKADSYRAWLGIAWTGRALAL